MGECEPLLLGDPTVHRADERLYPARLDREEVICAVEELLPEPEYKVVGRSVSYTRSVSLHLITRTRLSQHTDVIPKPYL